MCAAIFDRDPVIQPIAIEMARQFISAGLSGQYPFGREEFYDRQREATLHLQPERVAWVRGHLK
jgi:hypothetical protein